MDLFLWLQNYIGTIDKMGVAVNSIHTIHTPNFSITPFLIFLYLFILYLLYRSGLQY
jgi:hypothetical protein